MKKKIILLVLIILLIGIIVFFFTRPKENKNELTLYGNIEIRQVDLSFQVGGIIEKMLKEECDSVKKGRAYCRYWMQKIINQILKKQVLKSIKPRLKNDAREKFERKPRL